MDWDPDVLATAVHFYHPEVGWGPVDPQNPPLPEKEVVVGQRQGSSPVVISNALCGPYWVLAKHKRRFLTSGISALASFLLKIRFSFST